MFLAILLLIAGLTISAVAIYYSVLGLAAIFAASVIPIYIMGITLEVGKLIGASWLKANWRRAPWLIKSYMLIAIAGLMAITSMGIFGYLSAAHINQGVPTGDVIAQVAILDEKIKIEEDVISNYKKDLEVLNEQITKYNELGSVSKGVTVRKEQKTEREKIIKQIEESQQKITELREEKAPIAAKLRKVEAEVGPIKYLAAFFYNDKPDASMLERSVTWVIILIVIVFDPLAIVMLLAAQTTFAWHKKPKQESIQILPKQELVQTIIEQPNNSTKESLPLINFIKRDVVITDKKINEEKSNNISLLSLIQLDTQKNNSQIELSQKTEEIVLDAMTEKTYMTKDEFGNLLIKKIINNQNKLEISLIDELYYLYGKNQFANIIVNQNLEPELFSFIEQSKQKPRFNNYSKDKLEYFVKRIYELSNSRS